MSRVPSSHVTLPVLIQNNQVRVATMGEGCCFNWWTCSAYSTEVYTGLVWVVIRVHKHTTGRVQGIIMEVRRTHKQGAG